MRTREVTGLGTAAVLVAALLTARPGKAQSALPLVIEPSGANQVQVFWPATTNLNVLQEIFGFETGNSWQDVAGAPAVLGTGYSLRLDATNRAVFYRLVNRWTAGASALPDPAGVATAPQPNVFNDVGSLTAFLYTGSNAVQVGVVPGTIKSVQAAVLRGRVLQRDNNPLAGVQVSLLGHPEFGYTYTRTNGTFDLAVNGSAYTVDFQAAGFCPAQRQVQAPAQGYGTVPDVILAPLDTVATPVQFGSNAPSQMAMSSPQTDAAGTRSATVFFPAGTAATLVMPDGSSQPASNLTIRVTEFTVGTNGPAAMPAALPPNSGYTYCAKFSGDEALSVNAATIQFSQPVPVYVDNFLGVAVGTLVPVGYYDRVQGVWVPSSNGIVMEVLGSTNGMALIDLHGSGKAESSATLAANGFTAEELESLAGLYPAGKTLWRSLVPHFSDVDFNYGISPPDVNNPNTPGDKPKCDSCDNSAPQYGTINFSAQTFTEQIPLVGMPFTLNYNSARVPDYRVDDQITVPVRWQPPPPVMCNAPDGGVCVIPHIFYAPPTKIKVETAIAGEQTQQVYPGTNALATVSWDGRDAYGRLVGGTYQADITIAYVFGGGYDYFGACCGPEFYGEFPALFGNDGNVVSFEGHTDGFVYSAGGVFQRLLTYPDHRKLGLGGWSPTPLHRLDPTGGILYYGDGRIRSVPARPPQDNPITNASPQSVIAAGRDGTVYTCGYVTDALGSEETYIVRRPPGGGFELVTADSATTPGVVGPGVPGSGWREVDGQPASLVSMEGEDLRAMSVGPDGSLYVADDYIIARLTPDGLWHVILGRDAVVPPAGEYFTFPPDGTPANQSFITGGGGVNMAVGPDSSVYFTGSWGPINGKGYTMIRKIGTDGRLYTVFGAPGLAASQTGPHYFDLFGTSAYAAPYSSFPIQSLAVGNDGTLYVAASELYFGGIFRISPGGVILPFMNGTPLTGAGNYAPNPKDPEIAALIKGDEGKAATGELFSSGQFIGLAVYGLSVGPDGSVYFLADGAIVWRVTPNGIVQRVAGRYNYPQAPPFDPPGAFGDPLNAYLYAVQAMAVTPDGSLFIARNAADSLPYVYSIPGRTSHQGILTPIGGQNIPSEDATEVYVFGPDGRHVGTLDSLTGATKWSFAYDANSLVATMTDIAGNVTRIERDGSGNPTAIVGPYGQRTTLGVDANGFLSTVTDPANETTSLANSSGGLLLSVTRPLGDTDRIAYDNTGRATRVTDPLGGGWSDARSDLGVLADTSYEVDIACTNSIRDTLARQMLLEPNGDTDVYYSLDGYATAFAISRLSGDTSTSFGDGLTLDTSVGADPRFGSQARQEVTVVSSFPNGLTYRETIRRSVGLANPSDPLSLTGLTNVNTVNGNSYTEAYNPTNRTHTFVTPAGRTASAADDVLGRMVHQGVPGTPVMDVVYDRFGRVIAVTNTSSIGAATTTSSYDALGQLSLVIDPLGRTNGFGYDAAGRRNLGVMPDGSAVGLTYDGDGHVTGITPPGRPTHSFQYNAAGLVTRYSPPLVGADESVGYQYDSERNLTRVSLPDGQVVTFQYALAGRVQQATLGAGPTLTYQYGTNGGSGYLLPVTVSSTSGDALQLQYLGSKLTNVAWSGSITGAVSVELNSDLLPAAQSVDGTTVEYTYNSDRLVTQAGALSLARDPTTGQVTATSLGGVTDERQFDDRGLLTNYVASAKGTSIWSLTLSYDLIGRLTNKVESIGGSATTFGYTYDVAGRLAQASRNGAVSATYTYDLNGNRLTRNSDSATYDSQDRLQTYAGGTFSWSPNGNLQSVVSGGQTTTYSYDVRGALTGVALPGKPAISYLIDAAGRRIGKKLGAALQRGWLWDETLRDEDVPTAELDGNSAVTLRFVWASGANTPSYFDAGTNTYRVLSDERGSVRLVVSVADGSIAQRIDYDEFGQVLSDSAPGFQPFGFAGGLYDSDTGLVRLGARDYNAAIGRWTDRDPSAFDSGTFNLYAYCDNDPLNRVDIDGTSFVNNWVGDWADEYYAILNAGQDCFALRALVARLKKRENDIQGGDCKQNNENGYQQIHEALDRAESLALEKCTWAAVQIYKKGLGRVK